MIWYGIATLDVCALYWKIFGECFFFFHISTCVCAWNSSPRYLMSHPLCLLFFVRSHVREKYSIPEKYKCPVGSEDLCCSLFCPCFTAAQLLRHTTDYELYKEAECCSDTGLPFHVQAIIVWNGAKITYWSWSCQQLFSDDSRMHTLDKSLTWWQKVQTGIPCTMAVRVDLS
jgi:hypothetical protein